MNIDSVAYAANRSWTESADSSIYGKDAHVQNGGTDSLDDILIGEEPGLIEQYLIDLVISITDGLYKLVKAIGISLDNVIYGRVGGHTLDGIAIFRFELKTGNPYGVVGTAIYVVIASIAVIFVVVTTFGKFSIAMYSSGSAQKRDAFKTAIGVSVLSLAMIPLMPYFLDVALYVADIILSVVSSEGAVKLFANEDGFDIVETFASVASNSILNSLIYFSTILLSLYFAALYIGYAMSMVVLYVSFPIVCVGMNYDKKLFSEWFKQAFSIMIIPIMDCVLLMIPTYLGLMPRSGSMAIVKIFVCVMIVPARNILRQILKLQSSGMELTGVATMMGAARLAGAAGNAFKQYRGGKQAAQGDETMASYYEDMAKSEGLGSGTSGISSNMGGMAGNTISPGTMGGAVSSGNTSYMGSSSYMGRGSAGGAGVSTNPAEKFANINNFEEQAFNGQLSNQKMAELYRQRATDRRAKANTAGLGSLAGGLAGMGGSMFMSPGTMTNLRALGISAGGGIGGLLSEAGRRASGPSINMGRSATEIDPGTSMMPSDVEYAFGTVDDMDSASMVYAGNVSSGITTDNSIANTQDFCKANYYVATGTAMDITKGYSANNGDRLRNIYQSVEEKYNSNGFSNEQIRKEFKNTVQQDMMNDFNKEMSENRNVRYCADNKVNTQGMNMFKENFNTYLNNNEKGILSDRYLNNFDWMPRANA
jgi:hypothetical protein